MAHSPISQPDPFDSQEVRFSAPASPEGADEPATAHSLTQWANTLAESGGGELSAELALDLVLNDIVERARAATGATSAAIALARGDQVVCRATSGEYAPDLGVPLDVHSGLTAMCVRTREWQRCDDTESDARVDPEACRRLQVRSILVFPIMRAAAVQGVIEVFSPHPNAFGDHDVESLRRLAVDVIESAERAERMRDGAPQTEAEDPLLDLEADEGIGTGVTGGTMLTNILSGLVVVLSIVLGWMAGHAGWRMSAPNFSRQPQPVAQSPLPPATASSGTVPTSAAEAATPASAKENHGATPASDDSLVIYQNNKVVYRAAKKLDTKPGVLLLSPEIAAGYIAKRVEPDYPEPARQKKIQGSVIVDTLVSQGGAVERVMAISGPSDLAAAAAAAVEQWQFQPFYRDGRPVEFHTLVTVSFRLP